MNDLHTKYRPSKFEHVIGQGAVVKSLQAVLEKQTSRAFIFTGPSGVGKTTLARIVASEVGCLPGNIIEADAARFAGVDAIRELLTPLTYKALGDHPARVIILDEVHALSKTAWQALLKSVEEPPPHVYWVFCTTDAEKIPRTIVTRCTVYDLKTLRADDIYPTLLWISQQEGFACSEDTVYSICQKCDGSPRRAITLLTLCSECSTPQEAGELMKNAPNEEGEAVELARALVKGGLKWPKAMEILGSLSEMNPESIRMVVVGYMTKVVMSSKGDESTVKALNILDAFSQPCTGGIYQIVLALGKVLFS